MKKELSGMVGYIIENFTEKEIEEFINGEKINGIYDVCEEEGLDMNEVETIMNVLENEISPSDTENCPTDELNYPDDVENSPENTLY